MDDMLSVYKGDQNSSTFCLKWTYINIKKVYGLFFFACIISKIMWVIIILKNPYPG